jgi:trehalose 2-sulfotransferase
MEEEIMQPYSSYLICATPYDGSTLLCEALKSTGIAGCPEEYFGVFEHATPRGYRENSFQRNNKAALPRYRNETSYASSLVYAFEKGTSPNGVFGAKVLWNYFDDFVRNVWHIPIYSEMPVFDLLPTVFPNLQYIWFTAANKVQQAISLWKATQMRIWDLSDAADHQFVFNFEAIDRFLQQIIVYEMEWLQYFDACGIQPLIVAYEVLVSNYEETMQEVLDYLHLSPSDHMIFIKPHVQRRSDAVIELWCKRYYQIKQKHRFDLLAACYQEEDHTLDP